MEQPPKTIFCPNQRLKIITPAIISAAPSAFDHVRGTRSVPMSPRASMAPAVSSWLTRMMLTAVAGVGAYFYFKIYKPQHEQDNSESENMEISDGLETINEDEPADTDEDAGSDETQ